MPNETTSPNFLGSAEVCEQIGIDRSTLTRWLQTGKIAAAQELPTAGSRVIYLFAQDEVDRAKAAYAERTAPADSGNPEDVAS
jgi:predicted site-specific integrase-resolvase